MSTTGPSPPLLSTPRVKRQPKPGPRAWWTTSRADPKGNDRAQVKAIYEGVCDIAIINHYYSRQTSSIRISKPSANGPTPVTLDIPKPRRPGHAREHLGRRSGQAFQESRPEAVPISRVFDISPEAQDLYGSVNYEFPVNPEGARSSEELAVLGSVYVEDRNADSCGLPSSPRTRRR